MDLGADPQRAPGTVRGAKQTAAQPVSPGIAGLPSVLLRSLKGLPGLDAQLPLLQPKAAGSGDPALDAFREKVHEVDDFQSAATQLGLFDLSYDPKTNVATVTVRVGYDFRKGDDIEYEEAKPEELSWTEDEKKSWKTGFSRSVTDAWSGRHAFQCTKPGWSSVTAAVAIVVVEAEKDWHYQLRVTKVPKDAFSQSVVSTYPGGRKRGVNFATMDSEDLTGRDLGASMPQIGAVHEFGHMLGLDDEYSTKNTRETTIDHAALVKDALGKEIARKDSDNVMSVGNAVEKQHYVTVLEALNVATNLSEWAFLS